MAYQVGLEQAYKQSRLDIDHWAQHTLNMILKNFEKRKIFPQGYPGPYKNYSQINKQRKEKGKWHSTGRSYDFIKRTHAAVHNAADGNNYKVQFFFHNYLRFVDAGVGQHYHYQKGKKAKYGTIYEKWGTSKGNKRKQRPFLNMEFRHQLNRIRQIMLRYYGNFQGELTGLNVNDNKDQLYIYKEK